MGALALLCVGCRTLPSTSLVDQLIAHPEFSPAAKAAPNLMIWVGERFADLEAEIETQ